MAGQSFLNDVNRQFDAAARFVSMQDGLAGKIRVCNATDVTRFRAWAARAYSTAILCATCNVAF